MWSLLNDRQSVASEFSSSGGWFTLSPGERAGVRGVSLYIKHHRFMESPHVRKRRIGTTTLCFSDNRQSRASEFSSSGGWLTLSPGERAGVRGVSLYIKHYRFMESPLVPKTRIETTTLCFSDNRQSCASEFSSSGRWFTLSPGERAGVRGVSPYIKHHRFMESPLVPKTRIETTTLCFSDNRQFSSSGGWLTLSPGERAGVRGVSPCLKHYWFMESPHVRKTRIGTIDHAPRSADSQIGAVQPPYQRAETEFGTPGAAVPSSHVASHAPWLVVLSR